MPNKIFLTILIICGCVGIGAMSYFFLKNGKINKFKSNNNSVQKNEKNPKKNDDLNYNCKNKQKYDFKTKIINWNLDKFDEKRTETNNSIKINIDNYESEIKKINQDIEKMKHADINKEDMKTFKIVLYKEDENSEENKYKFKIYKINEISDNKFNMQENINSITFKFDNSIFLKNSNNKENESSLISEMNTHIN